MAYLYQLVNKGSNIKFCKTCLKKDPRATGIQVHTITLKKGGGLRFDPCLSPFC